MPFIVLGLFLYISFYIAKHVDSEKLNYLIAELKDEYEKEISSLIDDFHLIVLK